MAFQPPEQAGAAAVATRHWCINGRQSHGERNQQGEQTATFCRLAIVRIFPAPHHRWYQLVFFDACIKHNGGQVQANQHQKQVGGQFVQARESIAHILADEFIQRAEKGDVVIRKQAGSDLNTDQRQQAKYR